METPIPESVSIPDPGPFYYSGPIRERQLFFGRENIVNYVLYSLLENGQSISVIGKDKIGKTSLLLHVSRGDVVAEVAAAYEFIPRDHVFVYIDCASLKQMDESGCFRQIRKALEEQVLAKDERFASTLSSDVPSDAYAELCRVLRILKRAVVRLIAQLDDFDRLADNSHLNSRFFGGLRALTSQYNVSYLTTSKVPLFELERSVPSMAGSPFPNIFLPLELLPFEPGESREWLESRLALESITLPESIQNKVFEWSRYEPHRLQLAGACAYGLWCKTGGKLDESHCGALERWANDVLSCHIVVDR